MLTVNDIVVVAAAETLDETLTELNTQLDDARQIDDELQSSLDMINSKSEAAVSYLRCCCCCGCG